jgi:hypothetical protein
VRDSLPEDGLSHRFNKLGDALDVSYVQMARHRGRRPCVARGDGLNRN